MVLDSQAYRPWEGCEPKSAFRTARRNGDLQVSENVLAAGVSLASC